MPTNGLTRAVQGGVESFIRGKEYAEGDYDRDRKRKQQDREIARQKVLEGREDSNYAYEEGLRPLKREAAELGVKGAQQSVEKGALDIEQEKQKQVVNSLKDAWTMARYGDLDGALSSINKSRAGKEPVMALEWHPEDPAMDIVIATDNKGQKHTIDLRQLDKRFKPASEKGRFSSDKYGVLDTQTGKNTPHAPGAGGDDDNAKIVELMNGSKFPREELRKSFETTYGKFDAANNLVGWEEGAPRYEGWYNARVKEQYRIPVIEAPQPGMSESEAQAKANKEASNRAGWFSSDETDFGPAGRNAWKDKRAKELQYGPIADGLTQRGDPSAQADMVRIPEPDRQNILPPGIKNKADLGKLEQQRANKDYKYLW